MTLAALLAAAAMLLAFAAGRELFATGGFRRVRGIDFGKGGRLAVAALRLGIPNRLVGAGLATRVPLPAVLFGKLAGAAIGGLAALAASPAAPGRLSLLVALGLPGAGFMLPDAWLEREARRRRRRLISALPDALDLLAVGTTSGRSVATGFGELARAGNGPLAEELRMSIAEIACGQPVSEALGSLRERVPGSEMATLCASIERSRRLGSPLADQLRRQASALRRDQRRLVEERAARAAPKIQLVVALVLVPSVLLMIAAGLIANADTLLGGF